MTAHTERIRRLTAAQRAALRDRLSLSRRSAGGRLVAYVEFRPGESVDPVVLADFLRGELPEYMVPSLFVPVDRLPMTPSGKVDRSALPDPFTSRRATERGGRPQGPTEQALARVWMDVLGVTELEREDDFFADLGGHSLLVTRLLAAIQRAMSIDLPVSALFQAPTVARLARIVDEGHIGASGLDAPAIERVPRERERIDESTA